MLGNAGKELKDPRVLSDVGDVPVQEIRDCDVDDDRLMNVISDSVKLVMEEVRCPFLEASISNYGHYVLEFLNYNLNGFLWSDL